MTSWTSWPLASISRDTFESRWLIEVLRVDSLRFGLWKQIANKRTHPDFSHTWGKGKAIVIFNRACYTLLRRLLNDSGWICFEISLSSSDQINNYKHVRNRLLERNNIGSTYLLTKFAKPLLLRIVGRARFEGWASKGTQQKSKFLKLYLELTRILRERPQWLARDKHSIKR